MNTTYLFQIKQQHHENVQGQYAGRSQHYQNLAFSVFGFLKPQCVSKMLLIVRYFIYTQIKLLDSQSSRNIISSKEEPFHYIHFIINAFRV